MKIKDRLSLYFTATSILVLLMVEIAICITFHSLNKADFYSRLVDRANVAAQLYLEADEISADSLNQVRERYLQKLPDEVVRLYDEGNAPSFIKDRNQFWSKGVIEQVRKRKELEFTEGKMQTVGIYYNDNQGNFVILVSAIDRQGIRRLSDLIEMMAILLVAVTIILFTISRWFAQKALQPMDKVIKQMRQVKAGNLSLRVDEGNGKDEISTLAKNFNRLLSHLEDAFELQQTFVLNASHELRTPITSIIGEIEITLQKLRTTDDYRQTLQSVLYDAERLNETITTLLELAQVEMNYTQPAFKQVAIDELIWELNDYWTEKKGKGLLNVSILNLPDDAEKLQINANKQLLTIAFNNIIGNAFKFSKDGQVQCTLFADNERIIISITDAGIGILPGELDKVLGSFYRGANVAGYAGNGIGLYVTGKIVDLFGGALTLNSVPDEGTTVIIEFRH
ncbi:HAMP domain-containing sensor histidine kinase [soil metagenome]